MTYHLPGVLPLRSKIVPEFPDSPRMNRESAIIGQHHTCCEATKYDKGVHYYRDPTVVDKSLSHESGFVTFLHMPGVLSRVGVRIGHNRTWSIVLWGHQASSFTWRPVPPADNTMLSSTNLLLGLLADGLPHG